jgi:hypothetical protein
MIGWICAADAVCTANAGGSSTIVSSSAPVSSFAVVVDVGVAQLGQDRAAAPIVGA